MTLPKEVKDAIWALARVARADPGDEILCAEMDHLESAILSALSAAREGALREAANLAEEPADWLPTTYQKRLAKVICALASRPEPAPPNCDCGVEAKPGFTAVHGPRDQGCTHTRAPEPAGTPRCPEPGCILGPHNDPDSTHWNGKRGWPSGAADPGPEPGMWRCAGFPNDARDGAAKCCDRAGEYNGFGSDGPPIFTCPKGCACHD